MLKQFVDKKMKIIKSKMNTYEDYNPEAFFNDFYPTTLNDRFTISSDKDILSTLYHYASIEMKIASHLKNNNYDLKNANVFDIGSGAGHWIDFYLTLGVSSLFGTDISKNSFEYLYNKYKDNDKISLYNNKAHEVLRNIDQKFQVINAIGVMFHIVNDDEWKLTIQEAYSHLESNGLFIIGGHFGILRDVKIGIASNKVYKKLRSNFQWCNLLKNVGFSKCNFYKNNAYLYINDSLPENNILIATK